MGGDGRFVLDGAGNRIPQTSPPCWSCPKQPADVPVDRRKPLPLASDFGAWVWDLLDWFAAGRVCGFTADTPPLLRQVAAALDREERAGEREAMGEAVRAGVRQAFGRK